MCDVSALLTSSKAFTVALGAAVAMTVGLRVVFDIGFGEER
jgi:hypothetical protein